MMKLQRKINLALISPNKNAYSETFIGFHRTNLDANVHYLWKEALPEMSEEGPFVHYNFFTKGIRKLSKMFFPEMLNFHEHRIAGYLKRHQVDIILAEFGFTGLSMLKLSRKTGIPLITYFHGVDAYSREILDTYNYGPLFRDGEKIFVVSRHMHHQLVKLGCPAEKLILNPCGPAEVFFSVVNSYHSRNFLSVGRFVEKKAPDLTIRAFKKVTGKYPDARLRMVGDGPLLQPCRDLVKELGIGDNVVFEGLLSPEQIAQLCSDTLVFVQHSRVAANGDSEGTPVAVLEAGASGLPVVATRHAGIPDVVLEGQTGYLIDEGDIDGMAAAMIRILDEPNIAAQLGSAARKRIKQYFTLEKHIDIINQQIEQTVALAG